MLNLEAFKSLLEAEKLQDLIARKVDCETNRNNCKVTQKDGRKYINVDVGNSGAFMIVKETGEIFGIKAYGQIHRGHYYGTLDTINEWHWGPYYPVRKQNI